MHPTRRPMAKHGKTQRGSSPHHVLVSWPRIISLCHPKKGIPLSMSTHVQQNTHILTPLSIDQGIPLPKIQSIPYNFSSVRLSLSETHPSSYYGSRSFTPSQVRFWDCFQLLKMVVTYTTACLSQLALKRCWTWYSSNTHLRDLTISWIREPCCYSSILTPACLCCVMYTYPSNFLLQKRSQVLFV